MTGRIRRIVVMMLVGCHILGTPAWADPPVATQPANSGTISPELRAQAERSIERGLSFLVKSQDADGGWTAEYGPAVTAIVAQAFAQDGAYGPRHDVVRRATAGILKHQQSDGGFYDRRQNLANYQTAVVLMALNSLHDSEHTARIKKAQQFLTKLQFDDEEKVAKDDPWFGGAGYNERKRPDLSNTQMMLEALHQSGLAKDDPVYQRALVFVSRCQLNDATNDQPFADGMSDGGFIYSTNNGGESKANEDFTEANVPLRSYGSMTYSGFKSMLYAGLARDDARVRATLGWIRRNYTLDCNPGLPDKRSHEGLYYYYHVFARALSAWGEPTIVDEKGARHNWREDLIRKVVSLQRPDGSWINDRDRWLEGDANYITGLTVQTLQAALKDAK